MIMTFVLTALLIVPAAILILVGDQVDPLSEARRISRKTEKRKEIIIGFSHIKTKT